MKFDAEGIAAEVVRMCQSHLDELAGELGFPAQLVDRARVAYRVAVLAAAANGEFGPCEGDAIAEDASLAWDAVYEMLASSASAWTTPDDEFWDTPAGQLLAASRLWLDNDEAISLTEAAKLLRGASNDRDLKWVNDQITKRKLLSFNDPSEKNPQRARRVSQNQMEALAKARMDKEKGK